MYVEAIFRQNVGMKTERAATDAERALREYEQKIGTMPSKKMSLISIEEEIRTLTDARARELMAAAFKQADTDAPEIEIDGERWGNRRVHRGEYHTAFGPLGMDRSVYQRSGRGRVAVPLDLRLGTARDQDGRSSRGHAALPWWLAR